MNKLFSREELKDIYLRSSLQNEVCGTEAEAEWTERFCALAAVFPVDDAVMTDPLFDLPKESFWEEYLFRPYFIFAVSLCREMCGRENYMPGAFHGWMKSFTSALALVWASAAGNVLKDIAGEPEDPFSLQPDQKTVEAVASGKHFREMALRFPIFARQIVNFVYDFARDIRLLTEDLSDCLPDACTTLLAGKNTLRIRTVAPSESDRHQRCRTVHVLTLEDGSRLVYKPHSMKTDRAFCSWLDWMTQQAGYGLFEHPQSIDAPNGGLCTFLRAAPLADREEAALFFQREGFLMGALFLLKGCDMHAENVLACGAYPVAVDMETIIVPENSLYGRMSESILPFHVTDMSFLPLLQNLPGFRRAYVDALTSGTFSMQNRNLPWIQDEVFRGTDYADQICRGFEDALRVAIRHRSETVEQMRRAFAGCSIRLVLKPTMGYIKVMRALGSPECLADPATYEHTLNRFHRFDSKVSAQDRQRITETEDIALRRLDVPYFTETIGESHLNSMEAWVREQREEGLQSSLRAIRWCLSFRTVRDGVGIPAERLLRGTDCSDRRAWISSLDSMAETLSRALCDLSRPVIAGKPEYTEGTLVQRYYLTQGCKSSRCLLDASMGVIVALSAFLQIHPEREELRRLLGDSINDLWKDERKLSPGYAASEPGIADGAAGLLIGSRMCLEMGMLTESQFFFAAEKIGSMTAHAAKIRFAPSDPIYGCSGFAAAIESLPDRLRTKSLNQLHSILLDNVRQSGRFKDIPEDGLYDAVKWELTGQAGDDILHPVQNHTLRFGNAGKLYNYTAEMQEPTSYDADRMAAMLAHAETVLPQQQLPDQSTEVGLLHGLSGVLYSVCRYLAPDKVPPLL